MKISPDQPSGLTALDRPNSYIGRSVPRPNLARLTQGRGQYVTDVALPRMAHVAFVRSPHAHARITAIETASAKKARGVIAVVTGAELAKVITPWVGVLTHLKGDIDHWCVADLPTPRAASAEQLEAALREQGVEDSGDSSITRYATPAEAFQDALKRASENDRIVVFGSFYTVAGVMAYRKSQQH